MTTKKRDPLALRDWIGLGLITAFISVLFALMWKVIPDKNEQLIVYMLGQLSGFVATVVGFHYVTSVGDAKRADNTGKAFDAIKAAANAGGGEAAPGDAADAADETAAAATDKAEEIAGRNAP